MLYLTIITLFVSFVFPNTAHAYLDPSVGSILAQIAIATGVGIMFYFRKIKDFIGRLLSGITKTGQKKTDIKNNTD